jgi:hypothetical protein
MAARQDPEAIVGKHQAAGRRGHGGRSPAPEAAA